MTLPRSESVVSSSNGLALGDISVKGGALSTDAEQDDLLQAPSLESGVFGVLFTLSQEKSQQHIRYQWILLKIVLDAWQIFTTILNPEMGWDIDPNGTTWKVVSVLSFGWLKDLGYHWYLGVLYVMAGMLAANLVLCVWVAWSFKEQKFDYVWPIKVVRGFTYVFIQVFDITSLNFLQLGISCNYMGPGPHLHMHLFPVYSCAHGPHIYHAIVSGLLLLLFVAVAMLVNMSEVEVNPCSKSPMALGDSGAEVMALGIKALMTLVSVFLGKPKLAAIAYLVLALWLAWQYLRWVPHLLTWVNCLKGGVSVAMVGVAGLQVALVFLPTTVSGAAASAAGFLARNDLSHKLTLAMAISLGPLFLLGALVTWARTRLYIKAVLRAFNLHKNSDPEAIKPQDIYHFSDPRDVEIAARSARVWVDLYTMEKGAVHLAESIIKAGVALFPDSAYVSVVYANFMLDMLGFSQTGAKQLETCRKMGPGLMCRFMLFVRRQQATQKAASSTVGKGGNMDLLGYVEYQRKQRMVLRHHKDALQAMANFWRILGSSSVSFTSLSKSLEDIDTSVSQAETAYRVVLELYNNSPRLVRLYARFLETIKQDPWSAAEFNAAADRLEENKEEDGQGPHLPDGTPIGRMDDVDKGVLVVNAFCDIQVANKKLYEMFGYRKGELDGKNVTVLIPPHDAKRHPGLVRRYIDSGDKAAPYFKHPVLALHRERVSFTVRIAVSRASGLGEDSVFIGLIEPVPNEPGVGRVWVTADGVIVCCDSGFVTCFGYHPEDVMGSQLDKLLRYGSSADQPTHLDVWAASKAKMNNAELVHKLLEEAIEYNSSVSSSLKAQTDPIVCRVKHKYSFAKDCNITVHSDMLKANVYEVRMKLLSDEPQLLMVVERKGAIRHMSGDLSKVLGVGFSESSGNHNGNGGGQEFGAHRDHAMVELMGSDAPQYTLDDFLPAPWKHMHHRYRKYVSGGDPGLSAAWGCRFALSEAGDGGAGPTMRLEGLHGKPVYVHVAVASREEEGDVAHVVRMERSSLDCAIAERRVRFRVAEDGVVTEVTSCPLSATGAISKTEELFGFPSKQLVGWRIWDFVALPAVRGSAARPPPTASGAAPPSGAPPQDVIAEAEALVGSGLGSNDGPGGFVSKKAMPAGTAGSVPGAAAASGAAGFTGFGGFDGESKRSMSLGQHSDGRSEREAVEPGFRSFDGMVTNALQTPGVSWRVAVLPPTAKAEAMSMGNAQRAAAVIAKRTRQAVMRLDVSLAPNGTDENGGPGKLQIYAELWAAEAVTGVLEIDPMGRVTKQLEDELRPAGLLFGLPQDDLVGASISSLLRLSPTQSAAGLLNDNGVAKKSALKAKKHKESRAHHKVGPVHYLDGFHRDSQQLSIAVQVVGKPGPGNPVHAILRFAPRPNGLTPRSRFTAAAVAAAAAAAGGAGVGPPATAATGVHRVHMAMMGPSRPGTGSTAVTVAPSMAPSGLRPGGLMSFKMRNGSLSRSAVGATAAAAAGAEATEVDKSPKASKGPEPDGGPSSANAAAGAPLNTPRTNAMQPVSSSQVDLQPIGAPPGGAGGRSPLRSPSGAGALAAAVTSSLQGGSFKEAKVSGAGAPAGAAAAAAGQDGESDEDAKLLGLAPPPKPGSPSGGVQRPQRRKGAASLTARSFATLPGELEAEAGGGSDPAQPRTPDGPDGAARCVATGVAEPAGAAGGGVGGGGASMQGPRLSPNSLALVAPANEKGIPPGIDKWVASGGQFYQNNKTPTVDAVAHVPPPPPPPPEEEEEEDDDDDEEEEDGGDGGGSGEEGSIGATSAAPSSRWASPHGSDTDASSHHPHGHPHHPPHSGPQHGAHPHHGHPHGLRNDGDGDIYGAEAAADGREIVRLPGQGTMMPNGWTMPAAGEPGIVADVFGGFAPVMGPGGFIYGADGSGNGMMAMGPMMAGADAVLNVGDGLDDHSDGGDSGISGMSGGSGMGDNETTADFKRGKRYRKLVKLMDSPSAQKTVVRFKVNTALALAGAALVHFLCFALIITAVQRQSRALDQLATAGGAQRYLQRALVSVRALDQAYKGKGTNTTYLMSDVQILADDLMEYADKYRAVNNDLMEASNGAIEDIYYSHKEEVWSGYDALTGADVIAQITIWDLVTRAYVSAKTIFQNHAGWFSQDLNVSSTLPATFLLRSGEALIPGSQEVISELLAVADARTKDVNNLQLIFLLLEGFLVTGICAIALVYLLRAASEQRYQLYETFLTIPVGLTRALASQTAHLLDDDESDDEEEEASAKGHNDDASGVHNLPAAPKRKALFDDAANETEHAGPRPTSHDRRRNSSGPDGSHHGSSHGRDRPHHGHGQGGHGGRSPGGAGHRRNSNGPGSGGVGGSSPAPRKARRASVDLTYAAMAVPMGGRRGSVDMLQAAPMYHTQATFGATTMRDLLSSVPGSMPGSSGSGNRTCFGRIMARLWPSNAVRPSQAGDAGVGQQRRTLERNSRVANNMLVLFAFYSILIILFYSIDYATLLQVKRMVALQTVADYNAERTYRAVFYAQELVSEEDPAAMPARVEALRNATAALRNAYYTIRMGSDAATLGVTEAFALVDLAGLVKETPSMYRLFFSDGTCMRLPEHLPCPGSDYRFYQVTRTGADGMMSAFLAELTQLADAAAAAVASNTSWPGLGSSYWDFIYNVGTQDLNDVNLLISSQHVDDIQKVFKVVLVMHVVLCLLLAGVFLAFIFLIYLPLLRRMSKEKRRIAEMMSQLPPELDVMHLVIKALMGPDAARAHRRHHHHRGRAAARRSSAMSSATTDDAASTLQGLTSPAPPVVGGGGGAGVTGGAGAAGASGNAPWMHKGSTGLEGGPWV